MNARIALDGRLRVTAGLRTGGQFAAPVRVDPGLTLEALAEAAGDEDPAYDPDDPYGGDLADDVAARESTRAGIDSRMSRARLALAGAAHDRTRAFDWADQEKLAEADASERLAAADLVAAEEDLREFKRDHVGAGV